MVRPHLEPSAKAPRMLMTYYWREIQPSMLHLSRMIGRIVSLIFLLSILPGFAGAAENLGILGAHPKWKVLEKYQQTITHDEFAQLIQNVYCTHGFADDLIKIDNDSAQILTNRAAQSFFTLRFAQGRRFAQTRAAPLASGQIFAARDRTTNRWPVCASRSIPVISAGNGRRWKSAGSRSATVRR